MGDPDMVRVRTGAERHAGLLYRHRLAPGNMRWRAAPHRRDRRCHDRPAWRRRGFAGLGMRRAVEFFHAQEDVAFGLLVCDTHRLGYYGSLGWQEFTGELHVLQHGQPALFTYNRVMTIGVQSPAPRTGSIDLLGPPW